MFTRGAWSRCLGGFLIAILVAAVGVVPVAADVTDTTRSVDQYQDDQPTPPDPGFVPYTEADDPADVFTGTPTDTDTDTSASWQSTTPTGFEVAYQFENFYDGSGGLPTFGYAISAPVLEESRLVQYYERQRFERHLEHEGTPYEVQLGLLGVAAAARHGLLGTEPFQPRAAGTGSDQNCDFFPETGHRLCFGFRDYWQSSGLEFGDAGVSYRESVALFGYPISEEFVDPATGRTVQYFERARFEYHSEHAGTPYAILLGLLGTPVWAEVAPHAELAPVEKRPEQAADYSTEIAAEAMKHLGKPYVWGAIGPNSFDCSGFVSYVVSQVTGQNYTRSMAGQASSGVHVNANDLKPGDLVFQQNTYQFGLSHAGIYIGNGQFINAANPSVGVVISNLWDSYWGPRYYTARRIMR